MQKVALLIEASFLILLLGYFSGDLLGSIQTEARKTKTTGKKGTINPKVLNSINEIKDHCL